MSKLRPIIIIDDDSDDLDLIVEGLHGLDEHQILTFRNGRKALDYLSTTEDHPHLILCDINMPAMSGIELSKAIEDSPILREKSIPFIFLSTTAQPTTIQEAFSHKVQGFFVKPAVENDLVELLKVILRYWQKSEHPNKYRKRI
jgi:CheY-like chemotaxis protein